MPDSQDIKSVTELLQIILKAKKNLRIYPSNNPIYAKTVENAFNKIEGVLEYLDEIPLRITRNEIFFAGEEVFKGVGKEDNLALFFSRDGIKELVFKSGLQQSEFQDFLEIASFDFDREDVADDVVTLMWGKDFQHITYQVDESMLVEEDEEQYEEEAVKQGKERSADDDDLQKAYQDALDSEETTKEVKLVPITDSDIRTVAKLKESAMENRTSKMVDILYEMLLQTQDFYEFHEISAIVSAALDFCIEQKNLKTAIEILWRAKTFDDKSITDFDAREELNQIFKSAESFEVIRVIGEIIDEEPGIDDAVFQEYVSFLSKDAIPHFMKILGDLKTIKARKSIVNALVFLGKKDISTLVRGLRDNRWYVVRNIIYILRKIGDPKAMGYLLKAAGHGDPRVRKEMLKALGEIGGQKAVSAVRDCMDDPEPFIRTAAARALGSIGTDSAKQVLMDRLTDKKMLAVDFNEKKEMFEVLSGWNDNQVLDFLIKTIRKFVIFNRAKHNEMKAAAAYALGLMGNKSALTPLDRMRKSGNKFLSEYAYAAIKRIEHGR